MTKLSIIMADHRHDDSAITMTTTSLLFLCVMTKSSCHAIVDRASHTAICVRLFVISSRLFDLDLA